MIIDNLNIMRSVSQPPKADSILVVDADTELAFQIARQLFQPIPGQRYKISQRIRRMQTRELRPCLIVQ
jgi:hypothetical protein